MATLYYVIGPSSGWSDPTAANVKAGQLAGGGAATASGNETAPTTDQTFTFTTPASGLTADTAYKIAFVWSDGSSDSTVEVGGPFYTSAVTTTGTGALALAGQAPTITVSIDLAVVTGSGALTIIGQAPTVAVNNVLATTATGALSFAGQTPTVNVNNVLALTATGSLLVTGRAPTVEVSTGVVDTPVLTASGALTVSGQAPSVTVNNVVAATQAGALAVVGQAPTVATTHSTTTGTGSLTITGQAPTISVVMPAVTVQTSAGALVLECYAPTILGGEVTPSRRADGGGRILRRRYRKPFVVEIDGKDFVVNSPEEAEELLAQAKDAAQELLVDARVEAVKGKKRPITPKSPKIRVRGDGPELKEVIALVADARRAIRDAFELARAAELSYLLRRKLEEDDEDDAITALILH